MVELAVFREAQQTLPEPSLAIGFGESLRAAALWYPRIPDESKRLRVDASDLVARQLREFRPLV